MPGPTSLWVTSPPVAALSAERVEQHAFHAICARRLRWWLVVANVALGIGVAVWAVAWVYFHSGSVGFLTAAPMALIATRVRRAYVRHLRRARGLEQPFAEEILARSDCRFAVFLRGFDVEAQRLAPNPDMEWGAPEANLSARPVELLAVNVLAADLPVLAFSDPRSPEPMPGVHRFHDTAGDDWEERIRRIISQADLVLIHLSSRTPGLLRELELVCEQGAQRKTLVVMARELAWEGDRKVGDLVAMARGVGHVVFEKASRRWSVGEERRFQARFLTAVRMMERDRGVLLLRPALNTLPLATRTPAQRLAGFLVGPLIWTIGLLVVAEMLLLVGMMVEGMAPTEYANAAVGWVATSPLIMLLFTCLKAFRRYQLYWFRKGQRMADRGAAVLARVAGWLARR